jgi:hypothetical protein
MIRCVVGACLAVVGCASLDTGDAVQCCRDFGFDARPILGDHAIDCGAFNAFFTPKASGRANQRALKCALRAQREGRAFVYYRIDSDMVDSGGEAVGVFGQRGERLYVAHVFTTDEDHTEGGACERLVVLESGEFEGRQCDPKHPSFQRLLLGK